MLNKIYTYFHKNKIKGKDRIYSFLKDKNLPYKIILKASSGIKMKLDPKNYVDSHIIQKGAYESEVLNSITEKIQANDVLWDIGANIGYHSLSAKYLCPNLNIISFEPDYRNFDILYSNMIMNKLDINLVNIALSDEIGCSKLFSVDGNNGMSTLNPWHEFTWNRQPHLIGCTTGDFLISNQYLPSPTIIKLDVEGHEFKVLLGLKNTLAARKIRKIIFEAENNFLDTDSDIKEFLISLGYRFKHLVRNEATEHNLGNIEAFLI